MILYKYLSLNGIKKVLESGDLKFSSVETFNDPFEFLPPVTDNPKLGIDFMIQRLLGYIRGEDGFELSPLPERENEPNIKRLLDLKKYKEIKEEDIRKIVSPIFESLTSDDYIKNLEITKEIFHICSLSENKDNLLMWGHYTNNHKGGVLGFDLEIGGNCEIEFPYAHPVKYTSYNANVFTPIYLYMLVTGQIKKQDGRDFWKNSTYTKGTDWAYEKEWRMQTLSKEDKKQTFVPFEDSLREVYFGCKMSDEDKKEIRQLLKNYNNVKIFTGKQNFEKYSLFFSEEDLTNK